MAPVRRAAPPARTAGGSVNFGDDSFYLGGLGLPEGDYAMEFHTQMFQPTKQNGTPANTPAFLAVMVTAYPITPDGNPIPGAEATEHPLGCGQKTHESFVPSADGKGFESVPGSSGIGMNENCNWSLFRKSLVNSGLPPGTLTNDLSVIDGVWVHTRNVPEPEERKNFRNAKKSATGEAALQAQNMAAAAEPERNKVCLTVVSILEGGKPWEGTGGIPGDAPAAAPKVAARPAAAAARPGVARTVAPPAPAAAEATDDDLAAAAVNGIGDVLAKEPNGCFRTKLRMGTFAAVSAAQGEDMANAVLETYFASDEALNSILSQLGYVVAGAKIAVAAAA